MFWGRLSFLTLVFLHRLSFKVDYVSRSTMYRDSTVCKMTKLCYFLEGDSSLQFSVLFLHSTRKKDFRTNSVKIVLFDWNLKHKSKYNKRFFQTPCFSKVPQIPWVWIFLVALYYFGCFHSTCDFLNIQESI